jgi:hypothetical protein
MNVIWEINAISLIAIVAHFVGVAVFIVRASDRAIQADKKAEKALDLSQETKERLSPDRQYGAGGDPRRRVRPRVQG